MNVSCRTVVAVFAATVLSALAASAAPPAASPNPAVGKWKLNVAKSKFEPGPGFKSENRIYEDWGGGVLHSVFEAVDAQGSPFYRELAARLDGKPYPWVIKGSQSVWTIALKPSGPRGWEFETKRDGSLYQAGRNTVSEDGKTMTITYKGVDSEGKATSGTMVFDRQ